jgi:DNA primase
MVAPLGTAFTEHHARMLRRAASQVVLCFDADNAGYNAALKCYRMLAPEGVFVKVVSLPPGEDPDSLIRKQGADAFRQKISEARDFFDFQIDLSPDAMRPENVREKTRLVAALADNILLLSDKVAQDSAVNRCATRLNVPASDIRTLLSREARKKRIEAENRREATQRQAAITGEKPAATTPGSPAGRTEEKSPVGQLAVPNPSVRLLIRLALSNEEVFSYLNEQASEGEIPWQGLLGGEILEQILSAELVPGDPASQGSFMARLPEDVRSTIAGILLEKSPQEDLSGAMNASLVLRRDHLRSRSELLTQQMRQPDLSMEQIMALSVDISRIKRELVEVSKKLAGSLVVK